jgi:hypothetical protein
MLDNIEVYGIMYGAIQFFSITSASKSILDFTVIIIVSGRY